MPTYSRGIGSPTSQYVGLWATGEGTFHRGAGPLYHRLTGFRAVHRELVSAARRLKPPAAAIARGELREFQALIKAQNTMRLRLFCDQRTTLAIFLRDWGRPEAFFNAAFRNALRLGVALLVVGSIFLGAQLATTNRDG